MSDQEVTDVVAWLASQRVANSRPAISQQLLPNRLRTPGVTVPDENNLPGADLFMKLGIFFNGVVGVVLAVPIVRILLSSITRGRAKRISLLGFSRLRQ